MHFFDSEMEKQLLEWIEYKYRKRGLSFLDRSVGKTIHKQIEPNRRHTDRIFDIYHDDDNKSASSPHSSYYRLSNQFSKVMDRIKSPKSGMEHLGKRHKITFQSFRRFVYGTIDSLGQNQFAEYYIGHEHSVYWNKPEQEKVEIFRKIEPFLNFLDYTAIESKGADVQSKLNAIEQLNYKLRQKDEMNTDAIALLGDKMQEMMIKIQELETKK